MPPLIALKAPESRLKVEGWVSEYPSVQLLLDHLKRKTRSETSRQKFLHDVDKFLQFVKMGPDQLVSLEPAEIEKLLQRFVDEMNDGVKSLRYVNGIAGDVITFLQCNGFKNGRSVEIEKLHVPARYRSKGEYIPQPEEIETMAASCGSTLNGLRDKAMILCSYTSGLRNSTLRALRYGDILSELENSDNNKGPGKDGNGADREIATDAVTVLVPVYARMKQYVAGACKGNIPYFTFFNSEAVSTLRTYLDERKRVYGGVLDGKDPLFHSEVPRIPKPQRTHTTVGKDHFERITKKAARHAGIAKWSDVYVHTLRKAFESALRNSNLDPDDREFLMGHILQGSKDPYYDKTRVEEMRKKYMTVKFFPHKSAQTEDLRKKQILDTVKLLGFGEDRIKKVEEALAKYKSADEAISEIRKLSVNGYNSGGNVGVSKHKVVTEGELLQHLDEGWNIVRELTPGKIIIGRGLDY